MLESDSTMGLQHTEPSSSAAHAMNTSNSSKELTAADVAEVDESQFTYID